MPGPANDNATPREEPHTGRPCPICGKPAAVATRPFCSKRCADVDLHRWLGGTYRIPAAATEVEDAPDDGAPDD